MWDTQNIGNYFCIYLFALYCNHKYKNFVLLNGFQFTYLRYDSQSFVILY